MPLNGLGYAGRVAALAAAMTPTSLRPEEVVPVVAVGLPSLSSRRDDLSKTNLMASSHFGDGAATAVIRGVPEGG